MQSITLQPGKYYRTRDGRKAYCVGENPFEQGIFAVAFDRRNKQKSSMFDLRKDGGFLHCETHGLDIIDEWTEE